VCRKVPGARGLTRSTTRSRRQSLAEGRVPFTKATSPMTAQELPSTPFGAVVRNLHTTSETTRVARLLRLRSLFGDSGPNGRLESLVARMTEFFLPKGKDLYVAGTSSDSLYFIVEGVVQHGE